MELPLLPIFSAIFTRRNLAVLFILLNLKNLPLAWHARFLYHLVLNGRKSAKQPPTISPFSSTSTTHPIFAPISITSHAPLLEIDFNFHKSNSTYFSDLDISRTALVATLFSTAMKRGHVELEKERYWGRMNVVLGGVHCSFRKEIKPYERYVVRSRVLGWDEKWLVIGSWFLRPVSVEKEEVLAAAISKYVFKKGRFTVKPERMWGWSGLSPERPSEANGISPPSKVEETVILEKESEGAKERADELKEAEVPEVLGKVVLDSDSVVDTDSREKISQVIVPGWDWARVDKERRRGLELVRGSMALDGELFEEYSCGT